jgi:hypothetical protein
MAKSNIEKECDKALKRIEKHIEKLYNNAMEDTRIEFELTYMAILLEKHIRNEERSIQHEEERSAERSAERIYKGKIESER